MSLKAAGAFFGNLRMERKLFLVFLLLTALPLTFIGYITYNNYSRSLEEKTILFSTNMLDSMMIRIDDYIEDMVRISSVPAYQDEIRQNLMRSNRYYEQRGMAGGQSGSEAIPDEFNLLLSIQRGIEGNISFINGIKRGANSVYIFDQYGNVYYAASSGGVRLNLKDSYRLWLDSAEDSSGEARLISTQRYISNLQSEKHAFTVVRKIFDKSLQPIGLIAVDATMSVIEDGIRELDGVTKGSSFIVDEEGMVVYDSNSAVMATSMSQDYAFRMAAGEKGSFYGEKDGVKRLYMYSTSPNTKWKVITSIPVSELTRDAVLVRNVTWAAMIVTLLVAMLISFFMAYALTNPLRKLMRLMKSVREGDLDVQFQVKYRDEIGQLGNQFNRMIGHIGQLIRDIYHMETKKKEAELQALQNQINPHFMYNTLESIRMTAEVNDDQDAADMLEILGKLLRYGISDLHEEVTLGDEIHHVRNYVQLLNYRYPGRFRLAIDIPPELLHYPVIKLVLQPIVENAVYHGMDPEKPFMIIGLAGRRDGQAVVLTLSDDGIGMERERLDALMTGLQGERPPEGWGSGGIGLRNVNERLKLHYDRGYEMAISSRPGEGTVITLRLPLSGGIGKEGDEA
jgi:two-component system sensor histidine kinase YesM